MRSRTKLGLWSLLALGALVGAAPGVGSLARADERHDDHHEGSKEPKRYTIALWGDMPYNALGKQQYPNLLLDVNDAHVEFSFFDGDLKAGGDGPCTDDNLYKPAVDYFNQLERPLIWVPGDNDWTDCWGRYGAGTFEPGADDPEE